jgi:hypothetical protein
MAQDPHVPQRGSAIIPAPNRFADGGLSERNALTLLQSIELKNHIAKWLGRSMTLSRRTGLVLAIKSFFRPFRNPANPFKPDPWWRNGA